MIHDAGQSVTDHRPQVSFILATHNRREAVKTTLENLLTIRNEAAGTETIVVDNCSRDGTADMIRGSFAGVRLIALKNNIGSCAKAVGVDRAAGEYIVFLDDDSHPRPGSIARMIEHFRTSPRLAQAGFTVHLPDGRREGGALPDIHVGCGVGFRRNALRKAGGLDRTLFMQAEEYDLSFRLVRAGFEIAVFDDLHVEHLKTPQARLSWRTVYLDTRNNLLVAARYAPDRRLLPLLQDYTQRYRWIAESAGQLRAYARGRREGWRRLRSERNRFARWRLTGPQFERLFRFEEIKRRMRALADSGVRRIILADLGKNIYPFVAGAKAVGLRVLAIADDRFSRPARCYRGLPILPVADALATSPDGVVISNTAPVSAADDARRIAAACSRPVHNWFAAGT
ncbi:MAG TPA: glycosyltransferase [Phycisphaerae bacterium]|nr:glycosyltransferase [Phycisphaerae bacterium]